LCVCPLDADPREIGGGERSQKKKGGGIRTGLKCKAALRDSTTKLITGGGEFSQGAGGGGDGETVMAHLGGDIPDDSLIKTCRTSKRTQKSGCPHWHGKPPTRKICLETLVLLLLLGNQERQAHQPIFLLIHVPGKGILMGDKG